MNDCITPDRSSTPRAHNALALPWARTLFAFAAFVVIVVALECTAFNYLHWKTADLQPQTIIQNGAYVEDAPEWTIADAKTSEGTSPALILDHPLKISTFGVQADQPVSVTVTFSDEGSTRFTHVMRKNVYPSIPETQVFPLNAHGGVTLLKVEAEPLIVHADAGDETANDSVLSEVQVNVPIPFAFSWLRVAVLLCLGLLIWGFSPARAIFRMPAFAQDGGAARMRRRARAAVLTTSAVAAALLCLLMFVVPKTGMGLFQSGSELSAPLETPSNLPTVEDQYFLLAESLAQGRVDLTIDDPPPLRYLDNPYDFSERRAELGDETYRIWDIAYYQGHFYVYFGVLPALIFYLPCYLLTGQAFPSFLAVLICLVLIVFGCGSLLTQLARRRFPGISLGALMLCVGIVPFASLLSWCLGPSVYSLPMLCGLACLTWGAALYARTDQRPWLAVPGSCLLALTFACRPQMSVFCVLLIPFGVKALRRWKTRNERASYLAAALMPFVVVLVLLGLYNTARFGSPIDFGANYNLTINDMNLRPLSLEAAFAGLYYLLFQLPNVEPNFPFFCTVPTAFDYSGAMTIERSIGGLLWLAPSIWFMLALLPKGPDEPRKSAWLRRAAVGVTAGLALLLAVFDAEAAGVLPRYVLDFSLPLVVLGTLGFMRCAYSQRLRAAGLFPWTVRFMQACLIVSLTATVASGFYDPEALSSLTVGAIELVQSLLF